MARKSRTAVLKRQREAKKAEKAAHKRERRELRKEATSQEIATQDDLEGYGLAPGDPAETEDD
jgi:hypothetical protein